MRNCKEYIASIDIGTQSVVVIVAQMLKSGKLQIIASSSVDTNHGSLVRGEIKNLDVTAAINEALEDIKKRYDLQIKRAFVGLSGQHITCLKQSGYVFIKNSEGAVCEGDIEELHQSMFNIKLQPGQEIISILPQSYILDGEELTKPVGMLGTKLGGMFNVVVGDKRNIDLFSRVLGKCNVEISDIILSSIASSRAVLVEGEDELGVMVVDIGAGTTDVAIYSDRNLKYMGVVPIGGDMINRDIRTIGILEKYIERLKIYHGNALASSVDENVTISLPGVGRAAGKEVAQLNLANIIEARYVDIITYLVDILNSTGMKNKLLAGIAITGGASNITNIDNLFRKYFDCPIRVSSPVEYVDENYYDLIEDPKFSTAIGLILEGLRSGKESVVVDCINERSTSPKIVEPKVVATIKSVEPDLFSEPQPEVVAAKSTTPVVEVVVPKTESVVELESEKEEIEEPIREPQEPKESIFGRLGKKVKKFVTEIE